MDQSPRLTLSYVMPAQAQKHVTVNEALRRLDQLVQTSVTSSAVSAEPANPSDGDAYILPASPTGTNWGAFSQNSIAAYQDGAWAEITPKAGFRAYDENTGQLVVFDGTSWGNVSSGGTGVGGGGSGETNTASNVGTAGVGVFKQKTSVDLEFKKINAGSSKVTITDDTANNEIDIDVAPGQIDITALLNAGALASADTVGTTEIDNNAVSLAKMADMATASLLGRNTAGTGDPEVLSAATARTLLNVEDGATADQSDAEIETAYNNQVSVVSQAEAEAGTATTARRWTAERVKQAVDALAKPTEAIGIAVSDETSALTTGTAKATFRMPYGFTLTDIRANVTTSPTGSVLTVDVNESGTSILSTKLTIDAGEKTSTTAATAAVISDSALADDAEITVDVDGIGSMVAGAGLKIWLIGTRS